LTEDIDATLLEQRRAFLRPDSLVAIVVLSDENDCSMKTPLGGAFLQALSDSFTHTQEHHFGVRPECAEDPEDACCDVCCDACDVPEGCDPVECAPFDSESPTLFCWEPERRYGLDFLQPIERYRRALTDLRLSDEPDAPLNPLIEDLELGVVRPKENVLYTAVAGVPWQDVARRNDAGEPDLRAGVDANGEPRGGFQTHTELEASGAWDLVLGDPPGDPHMIESVEPREGLPGIDAPDGADPIHGHEFDTRGAYLQSACIAPLVDAPLKCDAEPCPCVEDNHNPACTPSAGDPGVFEWTRSTATPGIRQLEVARAIGPTGGIGSICSAQVEDPTGADYGLTPALFGGLLDRVTPRLRTDFCAPAPTEVDGAGTASCKLVEARRVDGGPCECPDPGRARLGGSDEEDLKRRIDLVAADEGRTFDCFCEIVPAEQEDLDACRTSPVELVTNVFGYPVSGWCWAGDAPVASELAVDCAEGTGVFRLLGDARPLSSSGLFLECE
jgi:hypothetical protein